MKYSLPSCGRPRLALLLALTTALARPAAAQLNMPAGNAQNVAGTYTDLGTSGTVIATANTDDANSAEQLIGFSFRFDGVAMDRFILNTNGFLKLGAAAGMTAPTVAQYTATAQSNSGGTLLGTAANDVELLSPFNYDLASGTSPAEYRVATTGTAPNRVCTVQWKNVADKAQPATAGGASVGSQYANLSFQVLLREGSNAVEFVYGPATPAPAANNNFKFAQVGVKGAGSAANQILRVTKASPTPWGDPAVLFANGPVTAGATGAFNFRQAVPPDAGRSFRFVPAQPNDAAVEAVQTLTQLPIPQGAPHEVRAVVTNNGTAALANLPVTLTVTGANAFTTTQTVAALAVGASATVSFAGFTPTATGTNTLTVTVPPDGINANNSRSTTQVVNTATYSYAEARSSFEYYTGYGPGNPNNVFATRYTTSTDIGVTQVRVFVVNLAAVATGYASTVGQTVFGVVLDAGGNVLARSADHVVTAAEINTYVAFPLTTVVPLPAGTDLYVGVAQLYQPGQTLAYTSVGGQADAPGRTEAFYSSSTRITTPPADLYPNYPYRLMIEAVTAPAPVPAQDAAVTAVQALTQLPIPAGTPHEVRAVVRNNGAQVLTNLPVTLTMTGANAFTTTQTVARLVPGASATVSFAGLVPTATGPTTLTVTVPADGNNTNNSRGTTQQVNTTTYAYNDPGGALAFDAGFDPASVQDAVAVRFQTSTPLRVTQVRAYVRTAVAAPAPGATVGKTMFGVLFDAAGTVLARSPGYVITAADLDTYVTFTLATPPTLPAGGDFYAGVAQTYRAGQTVEYDPFGVQATAFNQPNTFFIASTTQAAPPIDLVGAGLFVKPMIEAVTQVVLATRDAALAAAVGLYPNPAQGSFVLQVPAGPLVAATATLRNALGQAVRTRALALPAAGGTASFDVRGLAPGVYALELQAGAALAVKRVVLE